MQKMDVEERIRLLAKNTDSLIAKLDTLSNRIDTAKINQNEELVEYYEQQFAEASVEFMDSVETILDDWYVLRGEQRPPAGEEVIPPDMLDDIHNTVVGIVQGLSSLSPDLSHTDASHNSAPGDAADAFSTDDAAITSESVSSVSIPRKTKKGAGNKVDLKG